MNDPVQTFLHGVSKPSPFPPSSRYHAVGTAQYSAADGSGRKILYLRRRFLPPPERLAPAEEHTVIAGDRLDLLAAKYFGDPELFWRLCDGNAAGRPGELTETPGRRLRVTLPEGAP